MFGGHKSFLWGHWYPYFGLLVMSPLDLKSEWAALFTLHRGIHVTWFLRFSSGVTPADLLVASLTCVRTITIVFMVCFQKFTFKEISSHLSLNVWLSIYSTSQIQHPERFLKNHRELTIWSRELSVTFATNNFSTWDYWTNRYFTDHEQVKYKF